MGYAGHEEVVWESLADVNGENCEFFSGDFRLVGGAPNSPPQSDSAGWTTVSDRNKRGRSTTQPYNSSSSEHRSDTSSQPANHFEPLGSVAVISNTEQEDHDLALALQLQEEEEERQRADIARRRRETELSQQYIEQQGVIGTGARNIPVTNHRGGGGSNHRSRLSNASTAEIRPIIPTRRNNNVTPNINPAPNPVDPEAGVDIPPPSYEQAATQRPYNPPVNHPAHPSSSPTAARRTPSAYSATSASQDSSNTQRRASAIGGIGGARLSDGYNNRRASQPQQQAGQAQPQDKDCVVM